MNQNKLLTLSATLLAVTLGAARLAADQVIVNSDDNKIQSTLFGTITKIEGGKVFLKTSYAGDLTIDQSKVAGLWTDVPVSVRLPQGVVAVGRADSTGGPFKVTNPDLSVNSSVAKIEALWPAGGKDPAVAALERGWAYEANVDISGKSGNKSQLATSAGVRATLAGATDKLVFYTAYDRQVTDSRKSADQFKAGVDYSSNFSGSNSWYVRNEGGFDRIKDIQFYDVAAVGFGYDFVKKAKQTVTGRLGFSFRNENYKNPLTTDVNAAGLDVGFSHSLQLTDSSIINRVTFVPSFNDFSNYRATHESFYEMPFVNPSWKLRVGVSNDFNSKPGVGVDKMDTAYFTRLVLNWR